jgi:hypothetical protein
MMGIRRLAAQAAALISIGLFSAGTAQADVFCSFSVANLWLSSDGWVNVNLTSPSGNKNWWLCQQGMNTSVDDGITPKTVNSANCAAVYSQLLTAQLQNRPISFQFRSAANCSAASLPADGVLNPYYVNIGIF